MEKITLVYDIDWNLWDEGRRPRMGDIRRERVFEPRDNAFYVTERVLRYDGREWKSVDPRGATSFYILISEMKRLVSMPGNPES